MPIEIRELIIEGQLKREEDKQEGKSAQLVTEEDLKNLQSQVVNELQSSGEILPSAVKRALIKEILDHVQDLLDKERNR
ncbi:MAG: DUF5908 family protein [Bacteroidota bacterium]